MNKSVEKALKNYIKAEEKLRKELDNLSDVDCDCSCIGREHTVELINKGHLLEIVEYCLDCGGVVV